MATKVQKRRLTCGFGVATFENGFDHKLANWPLGHFWVFVELREDEIMYEATRIIFSGTLAILITVAIIAIAMTDPYVLEFIFCIVACVIGIIPTVCEIYDTCIRVTDNR